MLPVKELVDGLTILRPFFDSYDFQFSGYENGKGSGGGFTIATYKNGKKGLNIGYRYSIGLVAYSYCDLKVSHEFYIDLLGFASQKQFPDFQSDDKLLAFHHLLHDFNFLIDDFFNGDCTSLIHAAQAEQKLENEVQSLGQAAQADRFALMEVERARQEFKRGNYASCLELYQNVKRKEIFTDFDKKLIEYCENRE